MRPPGIAVSSFWALLSHAAQPSEPGADKNGHRNKTTETAADSPGLAVQKITFLGSLAEVQSTLEFNIH